MNQDIKVIAKKKFKDGRVYVCRYLRQSATKGHVKAELVELIKAGRVMVNFTEAMSVHLKLKANDTVSVRGYGRFIYAGDCGTTKKGRIKVEIDIYE